MKLTATKAQAFAPVTITITAETQKELNALGALFNSGHVLGALENLGVPNLINSCPYTALKAAGASLEVDEFHRELKGKLRL